MTNEEINKTLATWAGVFNHERFGSDDSEDYCSQFVPDYCSSLDLLAPLEAKALAELGSTAFVECLLDGLGLVARLPSSNLAFALIATAPPAIRARAIYNLIREADDERS